LRDESKSGLAINKRAFEDGFTSALRNNDFRVINPNDSLKDGVINVESPIDLARLEKAHGAVVVSIDGLYVRAVPSDSSNNMLKYEVSMGFRLVDAWSKETVCSSNPKLPVRASSTQYDTNNGRDPEQQYHLDELLRTAGVKCARELLLSPELKTWVPTPPPPPKPLPPPPEQKRPVFDKIVDKLSVEMLSSSQFVKNYEEQKEKGERLPIAVIGGMENESGHPEFDAGLKASGERFRKKLFDSKLFDVKDDAILVNLAKRIVASGNSATENGDLMEELKQHGSPDFFVIGNLNHFADLDGTGYYKFRVTMHSLRTGKIVWEGIETITSNGGSGK